MLALFALMLLSPALLLCFLLTVRGAVAQGEDSAQKSCVKKALRQTGQRKQTKRCYLYVTLVLEHSEQYRVDF